MITLTGITKTFPGSPTPVVDRLTLRVEAGETCVLIGPSGSGKTTTMKMINRLIEPTSGRIDIDGRDVTRADPVILRRSIGYVIQQIGLFPHMTIAENVGTVPRLLGWPDARVRERVDEMLTLVGIEPAAYRDRYPRQLSGGQRQRVGVARALAADPPVMLLDEPFGAIDPITRAHLQDQFLRILKSLRKTVVFVTHDIDEAIKMGDRIAIMRDGALVQHATPSEILTRPADRFVDEFVGSDRALKRLRLVKVRDVMSPPGASGTVRTIPADTTATEALSMLLGSGSDALAVVDERGATLGLVTLAAIRNAVAPR